MKKLKLSNCEIIYYNKVIPELMKVKNELKKAIDQYDANLQLLNLLFNIFFGDNSVEKTILLGISIDDLNQNNETYYRNKYKELELWILKFKNQ